VKKIRDESGAWIPVTYKSKRYAQWKERMKVAENLSGDDDDEDDDDDKNQKRRHIHGMFSTQPFKY
jgi:DBP10CT (NUC160) domain.